MADHPHVLVLGRAATMREIEALFPDLDVNGAETLEAAIGAIEFRRPDLILVAYHFDGLRPFRLIQHVRGDDALAQVPILLVRVTPIGLGTTKDSELAEAYSELGVDEFFDLAAERERLGAAVALARLRERALARLRPRE